MSSALYEAAQACRICNAPLETVVDLGSQPPANALRLSLTETLPVIPLEVARCVSCGTAQLGHTVDPAYLFRNYVWVTGTSNEALEYSHRFRADVESRSRPGKLSVLEIASNDGTFLARFKEKGHSVLGVDPARNLAEAATLAGIPTRAEFFGSSYAADLRDKSGPFDVVIARNVLPHVPQPLDVVTGMAMCLARDGVGVIEFHRADIILDQLHYDSIYHEHVFYYSLHSIESLLKRCGLQAFDVTGSPISGGSYAVYFAKGSRTLGPGLRDARTREQTLGIDKKAAWENFSIRCKAHRVSLTKLLDSITSGQRRAIGYGASARSATLLNYCQIGTDQIDCIVDANPLKQGRYAPGSNLRIEAPEKAFEQPVDAVLLLAWNFQREILERLQSHFKFRGDVLVPLPGEPQVIKVAK